LEPDAIDISDPPRRTAFSIPDNEGFIDDDLPDVLEFTDERTYKSIRHLYSPAPTHDENPDLNLRI
jgi:hypothetical protein